MHMWCKTNKIPQNPIMMEEEDNFFASVNETICHNREKG